MRKAVVLGQMRSGSTFLFEAIRSHPDVFGNPGKELFLPKYPYMQEANGNMLEALRRFDVDAEAFDKAVSLFKLTYVQVNNRVSPHIFGKRTIIHNYRDNCLETAFSAWVTQNHKGEIPMHVIKKHNPIRTHVDPNWLIQTAHHFYQSKEYWKQRSGIALHVRYEDVHEGKTETRCVSLDVGKQICETLGIQEYPLCGESRRVNHLPLNESILNWDEVVKTAKMRGLYEKLKGE